jgi:putative ABC transport system permease protein
MTPIRDVRAGALVDALLQDLRYAVRGLRRSPGFTIAASVALALGIGVNTMFFTVLNAHTMRGLPLDRVDRVLALTTRDSRDRERGLSYRDLEDLRSSSRTFSGIAAFSVGPIAVGDEDRPPERAAGAYVSANAFQVIGETPFAGRDFRPEDDRLGAPAVVMLGYGIWNERYGGDTAVVGRTIKINAVPATVIGIMPDGFRFKFPTNADLWVPLAAMAGVARQGRDVRTLSAIGRLKDDATLAGARAELTAIAARLAREFPASNSGIRLGAVPINDRYLGRLTDPSWMAFMTAGVLMVLIACANVANLLLMRSARRSQEIAIRASLGASRRRIVGQLLTESLVVAVLGAALGSGLAMAGLRLFASAIPAGVLPAWLRYEPDVRVLAVLAAACLGSVVVFGLAPALHVSRTDVNSALKEGGRMGSHVVRSRRLTAVFLIAQFALTIVLLANVVLAERQSLAQERQETSTDTSNLLTMWMSLPGDRYPAAADRLGFYERLEERLRAIPAPSAASLASAPPFGGAAARQLEMYGRPSPGSAFPTVWSLVVADRYFDTLRLPMLRGRAFSPLDGTAGHESVIVNERFVSLHFGSEDPVGRRIRLTAEGEPNPEAPWATIVGVSPSVRQRPPAEPDPVVYLPLRQAPAATVALIVRAPDLEPIAPLVREHVRALDADLPVYRVLTMDQVVSQATWNSRVSRALVLSITVIALCLSTVGLYAVTAYSVAQRTYELGLRIALGAQWWQVMWLVLRRGLAQIGEGLLAGILGAAVWGRLFGLPGPPGAAQLTDPVVLAAIAFVLSLVAAAACLWPARRATRLDPVTALREG